MPKAAHHHAMARQWELLKVLPGKAPGLTAKDIAERLKTLGFEVTKRTVERDLVELSRLFGIVCNDRNAPYGWHWMAQESLSLPALSTADAVSLKLLEELLRPLLPAAMLDVLETRFQQARAKLADLAEENPHARWSEKVRYVSPALPLLPPKIKEGVLEAVQNALLSEKQINVAYLKIGEEKYKNTLRLHPLGLVQRGPVTYLVATAFDYTDVRLYAVHRIREAQMTEDAIKCPKGFKLDHYIDEGALQFGERKKIKLKAEVSETLAAILTETPLSEDQKLKPVEGGFKLTATVVDSWQLEWWVLSQAKEIRVDSPERLKWKIIETLSAYMELYNRNIFYL